MRVRIDRYLKIQEERLSDNEIKINTLKSRKTCVGVLAQRMPDVGIQVVSTKPLSLRSEVMDISLAQVIKRCRDRVVSPWLLHHVTSSGKVKASDQVGENSLSVSFKLAVDSTNLSIERGKTMPTFHEQRSLSERLYEAQGINTQQLLGHSSEKMTAQYHNDRGLDWVKVKV